MVSGDKVRFAIELDISDKYKLAHYYIIKTGMGGVEHPHYTETYYLLAKYIEKCN